MSRHVVIARIDHKRPQALICGPIVVLTRIARAATVIEITVVPLQPFEPGKYFGPVMVNGERIILAWRHRIRRAAIDADTDKLVLKNTLKGLVILIGERLQPSPMEPLRVLKNTH
jgi:hypothetical protein